MTILNTCATQEYAEFLDAVAASLQSGTKLRIYHISTLPTPTEPLYASPPGQPIGSTTCESHFLVVSQNLTGTYDQGAATETHSLPDKRTEPIDEVLVLGVEILVFRTRSLTTIFVSKADSSGFISKTSKPLHRPQSLVKVIIATFLQWLVSRNLSPRIPYANGVTVQHPLVTENAHQTTNPAPIQQQASSAVNPKLVLSLFARSQNQYLFPGSIENATKHVLDDRQLIRWWCGILDRLAQRDWASDDIHTRHRRSSAELECNSHGELTGNQSFTADGQDRKSAPQKVVPKAYIIVPGCDQSEVKRSFFPSTTKISQSGSPTWRSAYPAEYLNDYPTDLVENLPIRCIIPRFPDDPKARYCDDLDGAGVDVNGHWRSVKSLKQFWETMEYRQECASGRLVGFIWVTFERVNDENASTEVAQGPLPYDRTISQQASCSHDEAARPKTRHETHLTAPEGLISPAAAFSTKDLPHENASVTLATEKYNISADFLLNETDFGGLSAAKRSTQQWIDKVKELAATSTLGSSIEGRLETPPATDAVTSASTERATMGSKHDREETSTPQINVLTGIRKKRKIEIEGINHGTHHSSAMGTDQRSQENSRGVTPGEDVRVLSSNLVRKKPKP